MRGLLAVLAIAILGFGAWYVFLRDDAAGPPAQEAEAPRTVAELRRDEAEPDAPNPSFDIVRIDSNGITVAAGRADPGSRVAMFLNGEEVASIDADANGEWSIVLTDPLPAGAGELTLTMTLPDGIVVESEQAVIVSIPETADGTPLIVLGTPGQASRVLQGPQDGVGAGPLVLRSVDYGESGGVIFAGEATPGATVRVLADGDVVGTTTADEDGTWSLEADATLPPGVYDLQVDQMEDGRVTAVVSLPFERVAPEALAAGGGRVVVQPGNSLWRIATDRYGEGMRYTVIYEANASQIRDPDLIYPGQIFDVPEE